MLKQVSPQGALRFPDINPHKDAPSLHLSLHEDQWCKAVAKRLPANHIRLLAPALWSHLLRLCKTPGARSDAQRGRWSEYRVKLVRDRVAKAAKPRLSPPALAAGLLQIAEIHGVRERQLEAICGLLALRRDPHGLVLQAPR